MLETFKTKNKVYTPCIHIKNSLKIDKILKKSKALNISIEYKNNKA